MICQAKYIFINFIKLTGLFKSQVSDQASSQSLLFLFCLRPLPLHLFTSLPPFWVPNNPLTKLVLVENAFFVWKYLFLFISLSNFYLFIYLSIKERQRCNKENKNLMPVLWLNSISTRSNVEDDVCITAAKNDLNFNVHQDKPQHNLLLCFYMSIMRQP